MTENRASRASLELKLRRSNLVILRLSSVNSSLRKKIQTLEKKIEKLKKPTVWQRIRAFIKSVLRVR